MSISAPSASSSPSRILLAVSSASPSFWPLGLHTGYYFTEVLHPYLTFLNHGFSIDCVSETGTASIDQSSIPYAEMDAESRAAYNDKSHPVWNLLGPKLLKASDILNPQATYAGILYCGGHGASIDFPSASSLQNLGSLIYDAGGIVGAVCHGPAIFAGLREKRTGNLLITGKKATGFSDRGEKMMLAKGRMEERGMPTMKEVIVGAGGIWEEPSEQSSNPMAPFVVVDERIVTGVNPMSAADVAQKMVEIMRPGVEDKRPKKSFF